MHTTGLVLTLCEDPALATGSLLEIAGVGPFTLGEPLGRCRAVVLEVADPKSAHDWHDWAAALPGVIDVEVVFVHWGDLAEIEGTTSELIDA